MKRLKNLFWVICFAFAMRACVMEPVRVSDESMFPVVAEGEIVLVSKLHYGLRIPGSGVPLLSWKNPQKGDLVVIDSLGDPPLTVLRRITAVEGDKVTLEGKEVVLKKDQFYLSAERPENSLDSRQFGLISRRAIIGLASYIWWPKNQNSSSPEGTKVEYGNRFFKPIL